MLYFLGILFMIIGLLISVALHELGHMIPAKLFGASVPQYMVGFGPTLWSRKINGTEYGIKAILLGGYVQIAGMYFPGRARTHVGKLAGRDLTLGEYRQLSRSEREQVDLTDAGAVRVRTVAEEEAGNFPFYRLARWQRAIVMVSGTFMNALLALVLIFVAGVGIGIPQPTQTLAAVSACSNNAQSCSQTDATPAAAAGLQAGDTITTYAGTPVHSWKQLTELINAHGEQQVQLTYQRAGKTYTTQLRGVKGADGRTRIGIMAATKRQSVGLAAVGKVWWDTTVGTAKVVVKLPQGVWNAAAALAGKEVRDRQGLVSIVGAGRAAGEVAAGETAVAGSQQGPLDRVVTLLMLLASLNIALFVFNLIPLTPLDGGHFAGVVYEAIRTRITRNHDPVDSAKMLPVTYTVFGLLALMTVILIAADIWVPVQI